MAAAIIMWWFYDQSSAFQGKKYTVQRQKMAGVLSEAGTRVPAPVYSEHSTRLRRNRSQVDKYEIKSQTNRNFFSPLSRLARGV